jgi:hypothetical protein
MSIDHNTANTYSSALNSYLTFCKIHAIPVDPTPETLSYYVAYQSSFINPNSVDSYLSGICNQLEAFYPNIRKNRSSIIVSRTLAGAKRHHGTPTTDNLTNSTLHDDFLFESQLSSGFSGLLRLGEMTWPDKIADRDYRKVTMRLSLEWLTDAYTFWLPTNKTDTTFEGNRVVIKKAGTGPDPCPAMRRYIQSRDSLFPLNPELWLKSDGTIPTRSWFINRLHTYFPNDIAGQSMRAGGATALAEAGASPELIKGAGRWSSAAFERYIRKNPILLHALILSGTSYYDRAPPDPG